MKGPREHAIGLLAKAEHDLFGASVAGIEYGVPVLSILSNTVKTLVRVALGMVAGFIIICLEPVSE